MKERFKKIMNVLYLVIFSIAALWEYMQFFMYYDLPQIVVILPIIGISQRPPYQSAHFILRTWGVVGTCRRNCFVPQPIVPVCCETSDSPICAEVRQEGVPGK